MNIILKPIWKFLLRLMAFGGILLLILAPMFLTIEIAGMLGISKTVAIRAGLLVEAVLVLFTIFLRIGVKRRIQHVRQLAVSSGLQIEERVRHLTPYDDPDYIEGPCIGYSLMHCSPRKSSWSLLIPAYQEGDFSNGWKLIIKDGKVSSRTLELINGIASEMAQDRELLEGSLQIESDPDQVWACWNETAGIEVAQKAFDILAQISRHEEPTNAALP